MLWSFKNLRVAGGVLFFLIMLFGITNVFGADIAPNVNPNIPGTYTPDPAAPNPAGVVANLYQFALMIGGLLAFVFIVYGAIRYAAAAGNPSQQSDAKDRIYQALIGLALLVGAGLILSTINPKFELSAGGLTIPGVFVLPEPTNDSALFNFGWGHPGGPAGP